MCNVESSRSFQIQCVQKWDICEAMRFEESDNVKTGDRHEIVGAEIWNGGGHVINVDDTGAYYWAEFLSLTSDEEKNTHQQQHMVKPPESFHSSSICSNPAN